MSTTLTRFVSEAAGGSGVAIASLGTTATATLETELTELWCDGYGGYKANITLVIRAVDPKTKAVLQEATVKGHGGDGGWAGTGGYCNGAINKALADLQTQLVEALTAPEMFAALVHGDGSSPNKRRAPVGGACSSDSDCKGARRCMSGHCTRPKE
ncbi:MAG: hypothetical protein U0271_39295 [Polyangiaceae bacterium]